MVRDGIGGSWVDAHNRCLEWRRTSSNVVSTNTARCRCLTFAAREKTAKRCESDGGRRAGHLPVLPAAGTRTRLEMIRPATNAATSPAGMIPSTSGIRVSAAHSANRDGDRIPGENSTQRPNITDTSVGGRTVSTHQDGYRKSYMPGSRTPP